MLNTPGQNNCHTDCQWAETNQQRKFKIKNHKVQGVQGIHGMQVGVKGERRVGTRKTEMLEIIACCKIVCVAQISFEDTIRTQFACKPALARETEREGERESEKLYKEPQATSSDQSISQ